MSICLVVCLIEVFIKRKLTAVFIGVINNKPCNGFNELVIPLVKGQAPEKFGKDNFNFNMFTISLFLMNIFVINNIHCHPQITHNMAS